jgi:predicted SnoaL-like aldol condensation-catalyzing enzyme
MTMRNSAHPTRCGHVSWAGALQTVKGLYPGKPVRAFQHARYIQHDPNGRSGRDSTWSYLWRVVDGRLDEHWTPATIAAP